MALLSIEQRIAKYKEELKRQPTQKEGRLHRWTRHLFVKQIGKCGVCGCELKPESRNPPVLDLRTNHHNEKPKGLLCAKCDGMIRMASYNTIILMRAIEYLNRQDDDNTTPSNKPSNWSQVER